MVASLLKTGFFVTLNLKERQKIDDLKLFENWSGLKIIWRKLKFWKWFKNWNLENFIWKLESWKLNLRIESLEIKFERNWNFENYLRIGVLKIKFKKWNFGN